MYYFKDQNKAKQKFFRTMKLASFILVAVMLQISAKPLEGTVRQGIAVTGTVTDADGAPVPGVNVVIKGVSQGTVTDANGVYSLHVSDGDAILVFSFVGYASQEVAVGGRHAVNVTLQEDAHLIEEVVVVGYAVQKKVNLSGAVQAVSGKSIENRPVTNVNRGLQ